MIMHYIIEIQKGKIMGEKLKTIKDLMGMKNQKTPVFENAYNYLLETMRNNLISKVDGERRIMFCK